MTFTRRRCSLPEVRMLQAGEFDRKAFFDMANHPALDLADHDQGAGRRLEVGLDGGTRQRHVDDPHGHVGPVRHDQPGHRIARNDTAVAAVFRQVEDVAVGEPGELAASLSRLRSVADTFMAKPFW